MTHQRRGAHLTKAQRPDRTSAASWVIYLAVFTGGTLGAGLRQTMVLGGHGLGLDTDRAMLVVNALAAVLLGLATGLWERGRGWGGSTSAEAWRAGWGPGFTGGFGSVSAITLLTSDLWSDQVVMVIHLLVVFVCAGVGFLLSHLWKIHAHPEHHDDGGSEGEPDYKVEAGTPLNASRGGTQ